MPSVDLLANKRPLRVGISGAGPGGLGAALFLHQINDIVGSQDGGNEVEIQLFDQARELKEVGAGIHLNFNTFSMLNRLGNARQTIDKIGHSGTTLQKSRLQHINGKTLELVDEKDWSALPKDHRAIRTERTTLQKALVQELPADIPVQLRKRLVKYVDTSEGAITLFFEDGTTTEVDLLIGADGLRSAVRTQAFPSHQLTFSGQVGFRTLVPVSLVEHILPDLPDATIFYHGDESTIFTTHVGNGKFELSLRARAVEYGGVSWGQDVKKSEFLKYFKEYHPSLQRLLEAAPEEGWKAFAMYGGPRLEEIISGGNVALVGDSSHPLSGAFGAGAGFALEDSFILQKALLHARSTSQPLSYALELYQDTRNRHYKRLYEQLQRSVNAAKERAELHLEFEEALRRKVDAGFGDQKWIYGFDAEASWQETLDAEAARQAAH
ncbi:hypothetical protein BCR35DRAFT_147523 [Leucosporidium creatinivorum]|uniref:FAD-binding domain-containing protein n=1 Tax=Leucosporidium creatinivorum TaxID=106004 RepID=A0A1Y2EPY9_9BASI|nr:hypothetical protein BCR35DRAFT_147523 [Leucosporidium creatinivorum]